MINPLVTVCIPTRNRLSDLQRCIDSIPNDARIVILVSDDSSDAKTRQWFEQDRLSRVTYVANEPPLGQSENVNQLFRLVSTPYLVLMHDDDHFLSGAIESLLDAVAADPSLICVFGRQQVAEEDGTIVQTKSNQLNSIYGRGPQDVGCVQNHTISALKSQIPNNGALISTGIARRIGYRNRENVGDACDFDFAYRLSMLKLPMMMIDKDVSVYKVSQKSLSKDATLSTSYTYRCIKCTTTLNDEEAQLKASILRRRAPMAVNGYIADGEIKLASQVFWGQDYGKDRRLSRQGLLHLCKLYMRVLTGMSNR
jgi:glycosyltransferase involved in cell wall biosynthesis